MKHSTIDNENVETMLKTCSLSESELESLVSKANLNLFLIYQKLSLNFIAKYIINPEYHQEDDETTISYTDIEYYQGYTQKEIEKYLNNLQQIN